MVVKEGMPIRYSIGDAKRDLFQKNAFHTLVSNSSVMLIISRQTIAELKAKSIEFRIIALLFKMKI